MIGIFLDDERNPEDVFWLDYPEDIDWYVVRNYADFCFCISNMKSVNYLVSFDHDIQDFDVAGQELTGYDSLKALVELCLDTNVKPPVCFFHTQNPVGKFNMQSYYINALKQISEEI